MKVKVISIKRNGWINRTFFMFPWRVTVKLEDGSDLKLNCWAGDEPNTDTLHHSIRCRLMTLPAVYLPALRELEGSTIEV